MNKVYGKEKKNREKENTMNKRWKPCVFRSAVLALFVDNTCLLYSYKKNKNGNLESH